LVAVSETSRLSDRGHAVSGTPDLTFEFEDALTTQFGTVALSTLGRSGDAVVDDPRNPRSHSGRVG
jgi:hypothetical protein